MSGGKIARSELVPGYLVGHNFTGSCKHDPGLSYGYPYPGKINPAHL